MLELKQTELFRKWRTRLKDKRARALIASRLDRLAYGHLGDVAPVGEGISELRIHSQGGQHAGDSPLRRGQGHPDARHQDGKAAYG